MHRALSNRFLTVQELERPPFGRPSGPRHLFAEGQWQVIRASLECEGWNGRQIELIYDQLRQGWPLALATRNVATLTGCCPIRSRRRG